MKRTQIKWVINKLKSDGYVTRNEALQNYISRLGALILHLKDNGWKIEGSYVTTLYGKDYRYNLIEAPKQTSYQEVVKDDGTRVMVEV